MARALVVPAAESTTPAVIFQTLARLVLAVSLFASGAPAASAQHYVCHVVRPGETVARIAVELTGNPHIQQTSALQIVDTMHSRIVSKRDYDRVLPGWQVCVDERFLRSAAWRASDRTEWFLRPVAAQPPPQADYRWLAPAMLPVGFLAWLVMNRHRRRRQVTLSRMQRFAGSFIREFEQPLIQQRDKERPLRSRWRCSPRRRQLQISLAPNAGRHYPNLTDHRRNVEYDVARVLELLQDAPVVSGQIYARGRWVVIPFQFTTGVKGEGVK